MPLKHGPIEARCTPLDLLASELFSMPLKHGPIEAQLPRLDLIFRVDRFPCP